MCKALETNTIPYGRGLPRPSVLGIDVAAMAPEVIPACRINFRRALRVSNRRSFETLRMGRQQSLSSVLAWLKVDVVEHSQTSRPGRGKIPSSWYTYCWCGMNGGTCCRGVVLGSPAARCRDYLCSSLYNTNETKAHLGRNDSCGSAWSYRYKCYWTEGGVLWQTLLRVNSDQ